MKLEMFDRSGRHDALTAEANRSIEYYCRDLRKHFQHRSGIPSKYIRLDLWARGLFAALMELEQSIHYCKLCRQSVHQLVEEEMSSDELNDYYLHIYFYKNAFIRIFSILDKLGYFLDQLYELRTAQVKPRFSYFTVLRQFRSTGKNADLEQLLYDLKTKYREPLDQLRKKRNLEIHSINVEIVDEISMDSRAFIDRTHVESLDNNLADLTLGFEMVCLSLKTVFSHSRKQIGR